MPELTELLQQWTAGDSHALEQALPLMYNNLRSIARRQLGGGRGDIQPTELVHDFYVRLTRQQACHWQDRRHFFAFAAMLMRRILIDHARKRRSCRRGGDCKHLPLSDTVPWLTSSPEEIFALDRALNSLRQMDPRKAEIAEFRVLLGCTSNETAELLEIAKSTADREWTFARAWLYRQITGKPFPKL